MPKVLRAVGLIAVLGCSLSAQAEIQKIIVDVREPIAADPPRGLPAYEKVRGRLFGEVDPKTAANKIIQDIELAPRNSRGKVEYISTFTLLRPVDPERGNRTLLMELPNRGRRNLPFGDEVQGPDFLRANGYSVVWVGWQGDLAQKPTAEQSAATLTQESLNAPRITATPDGPLTGAYLVRVPVSTAPAPDGILMKLDQGNAGALAYFPATYETNKATFTGGVAEGLDGRPTGTRYTIASSDWTWWNCAADAAAETAVIPADLCVKRLKGRFKPDESYTLVFRVRDPIVLGLGMAASRDAASFFRYAEADGEGAANPLAKRIDYVLVQGASQVGNLTRTLISLGFTADERGRRAWDGANSHIGGRRTPINYRFATPGSSPTLHMPGSEGSLAWDDLLRRCRKSNTCPKVFETFGSAEIWNQRFDAALLTRDLKRDIPLPTEVRRYYFPGTTHGGGNFGFSLQTNAGTDTGIANNPNACALPLNPNPQREQMRALLVALTQWVAKGTAPPASRYPTLAAGDLVPETPGPHRPRPIANPLLAYDFGAKFSTEDVSGVIERMPPAVVDVIPTLVPKVDGDGNELSGVPSVQAKVPLGTLLGWNVYRAGPYVGRICSYHGSFIPFARTRAERLAAKDDRLSIEERYGSRDGYIGAVEKAVSVAIEERFLLAADGQALIEESRKAVTDGELNFLPATDKSP